MNLVFKFLARLGLILTILPSLLFLFGSMGLNTAKWIMMVGTILWLIAAPMVQKLHENSLADTQDHI